MKKSPKRKLWPKIVAVVLVLALGVGTGWGLALWAKGQLPALFEGRGASSVAGASIPPATLVPGSGAGQSGTAPPAASQPPAHGVNSYGALPLPEEMRAMWIMFLELMALDFSSEASARAAVAPILDNCAQLGLNTVIVQVRPFGDAYYQSELFPWSHLLTGSQGVNPGFDPLQVLVEEAHARGLRIEALVNPFRVKHGSYGPQSHSPESPAAQHPDWVRDVNGTWWLDPGLPQVRQLVADGVAELVANYDVDGVQFDDYFYPGGIDESFDAESYAAQNTAGLPLADWRRDNINHLVQQCYQAVKAANPTASFGISPSGNNDNNYGSYFIDTRHWMANSGYIDYIMPQIYWGFGYLNGSSSFAAFDVKTAEWAAYPRAEGVRLFVGVAAYRIGLLQADGTRLDFGGNGPDGDNSEWASGHAIADQLSHLRATTGVSGFALYRYDYLFQTNDTVSEAERQALAALLA